MRKHAAVGQKKDKYLSDKDKTGQQVLDKASTWTNSLKCYDQQLDAPSRQWAGTLHCWKGFCGCGDRLGLQLADDTLNIFVANTNTNEIPVV